MANLKRILKRRVASFGSWITLAHPSIAEIMADAGFSWLVVDMEHSAITISEAQRLIQVISLAGKTPLVRVGENNPALIKRALDAGAHGVIVPMVNSGADAEKAVRAAYYPPRGIRGVGLARAQRYGLGFERYRQQAKKDTVVIAQIEHKDAIDNLEDILNTPGIDATIIGPYDLSGSLGFPGEFSRKELLDAVKRYEVLCKKYGKPMGYHVVFPEVAAVAKLRKKGYRFLAIGLDTLYLGLSCAKTLEQVS